MFKLSEIKELLKLVDQTSIQELEIVNEGSRLTIRKPNKSETMFLASPPGQQFGQHLAQGAAPDAVQATVPDAGSQAVTAEPVQQAAIFHTIVSPMVGTFYRSPSPAAPSFVNEGDRVKEKSVVCIIEAMKLMNPIDADVSGEIVEVLVENGQLVEYGQALFLVKPE